MDHFSGWASTCFVSSPFLLAVVLGGGGICWLMSWPQQHLKVKILSKIEYSIFSITLWLKKNNHICDIQLTMPGSTWITETSLGHTCHIYVHTNARFTSLQVFPYKQGLYISLHLYNNQDGISMLKDRRRVQNRSSDSVSCSEGTASMEQTVTLSKHLGLQFR